MVYCFVKRLRMDTRVLFSILIVAGFSMFVHVVVAKPTALPNDISFDIAKLFHDCNISNPITFAECLGRVKRQALLHEAANDCWEECMPECMENKEKTEVSCAESCKYCSRRTARQTKPLLINMNGTVDMPKSTIPTINFTHHIHYHNNYSICPAKQDVRPYIIVSNPQNCPCYYMTWMQCYCRPQQPIQQFPYQFPFAPNGGYINNNCLCPDGSIQCDACNPPFG